MSRYKWSSGKKSVCERRRLAVGSDVSVSPNDAAPVRLMGPEQPLAHKNLKILHVDPKGKGTGKRRQRMVTIGHGSGFYDVAHNISNAINAALRPECAPPKVKTLKDMSPEEIKALEDRCKAKITHGATA